MSLVSKPYTFSVGATIIAAEHNSNFDTIYNDYNGYISNANISASAAIAYTKLTLTNSIVASDINSGAAIPGSKLDLTAPGAIGTTTPAAVKATALEATTTFKLGTTNQGDILYDNGTSLVRLTPGTSGQFLKTQGAGANPLWASLTGGAQLFTSSGTFTAPTGVTKVYITGIGGGGGGGGATSGNMGGGGGSGAYVISYPFTVTPGNNYTVTINNGGAGGVGASNGSAGGSSVFDSLTLSGGSGGVNGNSTTANGGAGGVGISVFTATTANSASSGGPGISGNPGARADDPNQYGGTGGASLFGTTTGNSGRNTTGNAATANTGAGGGGCWSNSASQTGGAGAKGFILVQY